MAQLQFKGKGIIQNHHLAVPFHELIPDKKKGLTATPRLDDNLIIHGDNLLALKALLPTYAGKVKCIYIDPPYNTGSEGWVYNDNVSNPMMKEWLGKTVDAEDLTRHDKWLCMMTPRLKLLRELLSDSGAIFVSIDDNETHHLRSLMDEIFGEEQFVAQIVWENREGGGGSDSKTFKIKHEYILCFAKHIDGLKILGTEVANDSDYPNQDEYVTERGKYKLVKLNSFSIQYSQSLDYPIKAPDGSDILPSESGKRGCWRWSRRKYEWGVKHDFIVIKKNEVTGGWTIYTKQYFKVDNEGTPTVRALPPSAVIQEYSSTMAAKQLEEIFSKKKLFSYSKPWPLIERLLTFVSARGSDDLILDSFAGSGTTAHAVLALNKEDGGNRRFILVEMENYADKITAERVRRVIDGVKGAKAENLKKGFGGSFSYLDLGKAIDEVGMLSGQSLPTYEEMARYLFHVATGEAFDAKQLDKKRGYIGESSEFEVYLLYEPDVAKLKGLALTLPFARGLGKPKAKKRLVFAPTKYLEPEDMIEHRIEFAQLPFEVYRRAA